MKNFFQGFNLARGIILVSLVGSIVLAYLCWGRQQALNELKDDLGARTKPASQALMQSAHRHTQLARLQKDETLKGGQADLETYIRKVASKDRVEVGDVDLTPSDSPLSKGVLDKKYRIKSRNRERTYSRLTITNFLYTLEQDSRKVKVTSVKIEAAEKRLKPEVTPNDEWMFEAEVTSRQRTGE